MSIAAAAGRGTTSASGAAAGAWGLGPPARRAAATALLTLLAVAPSAAQPPAPFSARFPSPSPAQLPLPSPAQLPLPSPAQLPLPSPAQLPLPSPAQLPLPSPTQLPLPSPTQLPSPSPAQLPLPSPAQLPSPSPAQLPLSSPAQLPSPSPVRLPLLLPARLAVPSAADSPPPPAQLPASAPAAGPEVVAEVRVHGNHSIPDADILKMAGVAVGDPVEPETLDAIAARLRASSRFESVEVRKRYTSLVRREAVALILLVRERPGAADAARGVMGRALGFLARRTMFLPILDYAEGHGYSYGARFRLVDVAGAGSSLSVPLTWGGTRQAGVALEKRFETGVVHALRAGAAATRQENQHYREHDRRLSVWAGADRRVAGPLRAAARAEWSDVGFGALAERVATYRVGVELDTRRNAGFPRDAVVAHAGWQWLDRGGAGGVVTQPQADVRGFLGLSGQTVLGLRVLYQGASGPLPGYAQPLLGGLASVRGHRFGHRAGDRLAAASAELRFPVGSPMSFGRAGVRVFFDTGAVYGAGDDVYRTRFSQGAGAGVFLNAAFINLQADVAHDLDDGVRLHFGTGVSF